jgi:hypothetical protein
MKRMIVIILLAVLCSAVVSADRAILLPDILKPGLIRVDSHQAYITEGPNVYIYRLKDFSLVAKFGKQGEGPQEFRTGGATLGWLFLEVDSDHIFIHSIAKLSYYSPKGEFIKEKKTGIPYTPVMYPLGDGFAGGGFTSEKNRRYWTFNIYDAGLKILKEIYRYKRAFSPPEDISLLAIKTPELCVYQDKIYIADTVKTGVIFVFNSSGKLIRKINPAYEIVKLTAEREKEIRHHFSIGSHRTFYEQYKNKFEFSPYFPAMRFMKVTDGNIYIMTYKRRGDRIQFLILGLDGRLRRKVFLPAGDMEMLYYCPFEIKNGKFYYFEELEEDGSRLHITDIR